MHKRIGLMYDDQIVVRNPIITFHKEHVHVRVSGRDTPFAEVYLTKKQTKTLIRALKDALEEAR